MTTNQLPNQTGGCRPTSLPDAGRVKRPSIFAIGSDAKTVKGEKVGILTAVSYMAPATMSGFNVCPAATPDCAAACLGHSAGRVSFTPMILQSRIARVHWFREDRRGYMAQAVRELEALNRKARREGLRPACRKNGASDILWERIPCERDGVTFPNLMRAFPEITFYDYTKMPRRLRGETKGGALPPNYSLTFSLAETDANAAEAETWLQSGGNVAAVFAIPQRRGNTPAGPMPLRFTIGETTRPVIDGDLNDVRFFDEPGHVVGLRAKGSAKTQRIGGFVKDPHAAVTVSPIDLLLAA